jgi:serine/threonine protein kinase
LTGAGVVMGTADYIAPEQAGDARNADIRADIYSLGCTLYQLLSGRVPFPGGSAIDKIMQHTANEPVRLEHLRKGLPPGLPGVVKKMMAKDPAARYQTPAQVAAALTPFVGAQPLRRRWRIPAVAALLLLLLGSLVLRGIWPPDSVTNLDVSEQDAVNRKASEAVLRGNGSVVIKVSEGGRQTLTGPAAKLPSARFRVSVVESRTMDDESLRALSELEELTTVNLSLAPLTGSGLRHLQASKNLRSLVLDHTRLSDDGLASLKDLPGLETLSLVGCNVTDVGLAHLYELPAIRSVNLIDTRVTSAAIEKLRAVRPNLSLGMGRDGKGVFYSAQAADSAAVNRKAAEWVLRQGGRVFVKSRESCNKST